MITTEHQADWTDVERMLYDAHSLLEEIKERYFLISVYPYMDKERTDAIDMERQIDEFLKRPLFSANYSEVEK